MPYEGEFANKASHSNIIKNPDVELFLKECTYLKIPSKEEGETIRAKFLSVPVLDVTLPEQVIAFDGSLYEASIDEYLPSTKVGYVKLGSMLINMTQFKNLRVNNGRFVDPFRVAELQSNNDPLTFSLPSANIRWGAKETVQHSFRAAVDHALYSSKTRFRENDPSTSLRATLFHLAALRDGESATGDVSKLKIHKCPTCGKGPVLVEDSPVQQYCSNEECKADVYPSDCLRIWEEVSEYQSNSSALTRFMLTVEHMLPIHYIRYLAENSFSLLGSLAFFIDGPLALFGPSAWLHASIMKYIYEINQRLIKAQLPSLIIIGLQKTGQIADHIQLVKRLIPPNRTLIHETIPRNSIFALDDDYRYQYVCTGREKAKNGFGAETYYGQDFIYNTLSNRTFVFALPYPYAEKSSIPGFRIEKTNLESYTALSRALALIHHLETDLYKNAVVPIALAHKYTAISLSPGGRVLDLLTRKALFSKSHDR
jgi:hypothetical protein